MLKLKKALAAETKISGNGIHRLPVSTDLESTNNQDSEWLNNRAGADKQVT